jgi:hypothetical protein
LQLIFITEFFRLVDNPSNDKLKQLEKWFWQTTYSSYFSIYSLSKQRKAFSQFQRFCRGEEIDPLYISSSNEIFEAPEFPTKIYYGSVRSKALGLFLIKHIIENSNMDNYEFDDFYSFIKQEKDSALLFPKFKGLDYHPKYSGLSVRKSIKDYSFILNGSIPNFCYSANFIDDSMLQYKSDIKEFKRLRYKLISNKEAEFVKSLGIDYNNTDRYSKDESKFLF